MPEETSKQANVKVWVGHFPSLEQVDAYFHQTCDSEDEEEGDEAPFSDFASGQGIRFADHDFLEHVFSSELTTDVRALLEGFSFSSAWIEEAMQAFQEEPQAINTVVVFFGEGLDEPSSVSGAGFTLRYLGQFRYDPRAESVIAEQQSDIPDTIQLELQTPGSLQFEGRPTRDIVMDSRGLAIGRGGASTAPYLDLSTLEGTDGLLPLQLRICQD